MTAPVTFWFDFGSPYSWLAAEQIEAVATRCGRPLVWRAILLGVVFRETGMAPLGVQPLRGDYARLDVARLARWAGLPFATAIVADGVSLALARVFYALDAADPALAARFAREAMRAGFGHGEDLSTPEAAQAFATRLGMGEAAAGAESPAARAALRAATAEALRLGVFGAPFFIVEGEPFWGQDRLPLLEAWLAERADRA